MLISAVTVSAVALAAAAGPSIAAADGPAVVAHGAKKGKKKKPPIATVNGTFRVRADNPDGFGNDKGPNWQQLTVVVRDLKIPFRGSNRQSAESEESVKFAYEAEAHTEDWSYALGCDRADRAMSGTWTGITMVKIRETSWRETKGTSKKYLGWQVVAAAPKRGIELESTGSHQEWESILMSNCLTITDDPPLGSWSQGFARPDGLGKLSTDGKSVPLTEINTGPDQTGSAQGTIKFNRPIDR